MCGKLNFLSLQKFIVLISSLVNSCIALDSQLSLSYFLGIQLLSLMHFGSVLLRMEVFPSPFWNLFGSFLLSLEPWTLQWQVRMHACVCSYVSCWAAAAKGASKGGRRRNTLASPFLCPPVSCQHPHWPARPGSSRPGSKESYPGTQSKAGEEQGINLKADRPRIRTIKMTKCHTEHNLILLFYGFKGYKSQTY